MTPVPAALLGEEAYGARLLRTEHELHQVPFTASKCKVLYAVGKTGCTGLQAEDCVVTYENTAIWTSGKTVRKRFTVDSEILQVCWVTFSNQTSNQTIPSSPPAPAPTAADAANVAGTKPSPATALAASWQAKERNVSPLGLTHSTSPLFGTTPAAGGTAAATPAADVAAANITGIVTPAARLTSSADAAQAVAASAPPALAAAGPQGVDQAVLCLLHKASITCIYPTGELLETPLLQPCHALWPLPSGLLLAGPADSSASLLTHPLEEPLPVVADCSISSGGGRDTVAAFAGWSQERVVWSSRELPYVATYNESRGRLNIWQMRPLPPEAAGIGSSFDLPVVSPMGLLQPRTPAAATAAAVFGSPGGGFTGFGSGPAGYSPAAYSGSLLGHLTAGVTPKTGNSNYANWSMGGGSAAKRSSLRTPQGCLPASIFNPTPAQTPWAGGLGALGVLRPCFSNTTQAQQAMLLPGPDPPVMFKLVCREELVGGVVPHEACVATAADACPLLCVVCKGGAPQLLAFRLPDATFPQHSVKLAFSVPALAAVPVATQYTIPHSNNDSSSQWQLFDLLILQPNGNLLLQRGSHPLTAVTLHLPSRILTQLRLTVTAQQHQQHQRQGQRLSLVGAAPGAAGLSLLAEPGARALGAAGSLGCLSMDEGSDGDAAESDDMMMSPGSTVKPGATLPMLTPPAASRQQPQQQPNSPTQLTITDLQSAASNRFSLHVKLSGPVGHTSPAAGAEQQPELDLRVKLSLSWLPGLPTQVLQALQETLPEQVYLQMLGACLQQQGACCGLLTTEWRVIATVILAWALNPRFCEQLSPSGHQQPSLVVPDGGDAAPAAGHAVQATPARTPPTAGLTAVAGAAAADEDGYTDDMDMVTPVAATAAQRAPASAVLQPFQQLHQQQQGPGSAMSDMSMAMSIDSASMATTGARNRAVSGTPMSVSTTRMASRLQVGTGNAATVGFGAAADAYFPTATATAGAQGHAAPVKQVGVDEGLQEAAGLSAQQQQQELQQLHPTADAAWQQLLASQQSKQLLQALPFLQSPLGKQQQQQQEGGAEHLDDKIAAPTPQQQQHVASEWSPQHKQQVLAVLHSIHSVYEDCKLARLRLYQLQMLAPLCWTLAGWMGAASYQELYERDGSASGIASAAHELCQAASLLAGHAAAAVRAVPAEACRHGQQQREPALQQHELTRGSIQHGQVSIVACSPPEGLLEPPGDILCCIRQLLSATGKHDKYLPWLVHRNSSAVLRSCQVTQIFKLLASCTSKCAAAVAAAAAGKADTQLSPEGAAANHSSQAFGSPLLESLFSPTATAAGTAAHGAPAAAAAAASNPIGFNHGSAAPVGQLSSIKGDALAAELEYILLLHSQQLVLLLVQQGWDVLQLDGLPIGVALPIKEAVARCRANPPAGWPVMAYALIGREDVAATLASNSSAAAGSAAKQSVHAAKGSCSSGSEQAVTAGKTHATAPTALQPPDAAPHQARGPDVAAHSVQQQHLLLPYEQRLLLPSSSRRCDHSRHGKGLHPTADTLSTGKHSSVGHSRRTGRSWGRGLRAAGTVAGSGAASAEQFNLGPATEFAAPIDGMDGLLDGVSVLRFGRDERLAEVRALLSTHMPVALSISVSDSDPDLQAKQQAALLSAAMRTMAMPLGRGALTLGLSEPLPGEQLAVPLLCLSGVVAGPGGDAGATGGRILVSLDLQAAQAAPGAAADVTAWCEFHNGVAAGLKIAPRRHSVQSTQQQTAGLQENTSGGGTLADAWLPHSKRTVPNYGHAGVLLGLGLQGHLDRLSWTDLYRYLSDQHDATTVGVLLGMSACCRGSADTTVARMLFLHLPARHPNTFPEIELSPHVQAASLLGLGLLYQGSCHRLMTETMLEEIGRTPGVNPSLANMAQPAGGAVDGASLSALMCVTHDREAYALAAGFGLGLICLGQGRNAPGLADLHLEDKLRSLMVSSIQHHVQHKPHTSELKSNNIKGNSDRPHSFLDSVLGPGVVTWDPVHGEDPTGQSAASAAGASTLKLDSEQQQQYGIAQVVMETAGVNTFVSGPAAAMALMMMYLKTHDAGVAAKFKVPDTLYALDHMRPDMIQLMVVGGALVMWDSIAPTQEWISKQLPPLIDHPVQTILDSMLSAGPDSAPAGQPNLDWGAIGLAHVHALSGACFAIGLRFAGTCNAAAEALLRQHLLQLLHAKRRAPGGPNDQSVAPVVAAAAAAAAASATGVGVGMSPAAASVGKLDKQAIENSICMVLLSLALVMAGSGHLPTFRLIQALNRRSAGPLRATAVEGQTLGGIAALLAGPGISTGNLNYGNHLAVSLAAGLLFLSAGRSSISTSNESIAALLIALYPVWPSSPTDHRCHLQAFRHLYVLAAEPRCLQAVDVHSRRQVVVPLEIAAHKHGLCGPAADAATAAADIAGTAARDPQQQQGVQGLMVGIQKQQQTEQAQTEAAQQQNGSDAMMWSPPASAGSTEQPRLDSTAAASVIGHTAQDSTESVLVKRHAPCLLPERDQLKSLQICGPRYWPVQVTADNAAAQQYGPTGGQGSAQVKPAAHRSQHELSSSSSWSELYLQQRICVKKKAGSLAYTDDPSGVKSLLFRAFYSGSRSVGGNSSNTAKAENALQQQDADEGSHKSFDIVHLCNTFSADPQIHAFAQLLRSASSAACCKQPTGDDGAFLSFCHGALYECIVEEKTAVLPWYMQLHALVHRVCAAAAAVAGLKRAGAAHQGIAAKTSPSISWSFRPLPLISSHGAAGVCTGVPLTSQLQDVQLVLCYYGSSIAAAAAACRDAAANSSRMDHIPGQQQHLEAWQDNALCWLPLLQPGYCDSLWKVLLQHWRQAGLLPAAGPAVESSNQPSSLLQQYLSAGTMQTVVGTQALGCKAGGYLKEQLLASCLSLLGMPDAAEIWRVLQDIDQQGHSHQHEQRQLSELQWVPKLAEHMPEVPGSALLAVAAAVQMMAERIS